MKYIKPQYGTIDIFDPFNRTKDFPLDYTSLYDSIESAINYLKKGNSYVGQLISVVDESGTTQVYKIDLDEEGNKVLNPIEAEGGIANIVSDDNDLLITNDEKNKITKILLKGFHGGTIDL